MEVPAETSHLVTVTQATTITNLISTPNPSIFGSPVTFTATVTGNTPTAIVPTGTVTFFDGLTPIETVALNGAGQATLTLSNLSAGNHSITALYNGDTNFESSSASLIQVMTKANTTTNLISSSNPSIFRKPVTFTATVTGDTSTPIVPTGTVTFFDGLNPIETVTLNGAGQAMLTLSNLSIGVHFIIASYSGDTNFNSSNASLIQIVGLLHPPKKLHGCQIKKECCKKTDLINILKWKTPSTGIKPIAYRIYRNRALTKLLAEIPANDQLQFKDHNRKKNRAYDYFIVLIDEFGEASNAVKITIPHKKKRL